jgi:prevent-host-death family protein
VTEIGAFEAKNCLGQLLDRVERGEEIVITRRGKAVARLAPLAEKRDINAARKAVDAIFERSRGVTLGRLAIRELIDEGRK